MVYITPSGESWSVVSEIVEGWKNYRLLQETEDSGSLRYNAEIVFPPKI
jgi:hypothetical protein